ncbi:hypothetical protein A6B35_33895 (plasmid) [Mesorhizobium amorphae CCNWGS0123]|nr:hypothetical protein A6B35_33895 [Mesorhizobium amorphae CCNWGS0123]
MWFIPFFSIKGSYTEVNDLGIWERSSIAWLRHLRGNLGQVEIAPDRMAWLLLTAPLFQFTMNGRIWRFIVRSLM